MMFRGTDVLPVLCSYRSVWGSLNVCGDAHYPSHRLLVHSSAHTICFRQAHRSFVCMNAQLQKWLLARAFQNFNIPRLHCFELYHTSCLHTSISCFQIVNRRNIFQGVYREASDVLEDVNILFLTVSKGAFGAFLYVFYLQNVMLSF